MAWRDRNASCCATTGLAHQMQENGAAASLPARATVPVEIEHHVILPVRTGHDFVAGRKGQRNQSIVTAMAWGIAPAMAGAERPHAATRARRQAAIGPPEAGKNAHPCARRFAVPLALVVRQPVSSDAAWDAQRAGHQPGARSSRLKTPDKKRLNILYFHDLTEKSVAGACGGLAAPRRVCIPSSRKDGS